MSQKIYSWILKVGVYLAFVSIFLIDKDFLFPYITSKQIYFNVLVEIMVVFWVALIVKYPSWRPKKSWISYGLVAFFLAMLASCFVSIDKNLSFWGDVERMLGFFPIVHFLFFYFIIITVFRTKDDWKYLMIASISAAALNGIYGMGIKEQHTTIGNTAYVSGYMIFNLYFAALLFIKEKNWPIRSLYVLAALPMMHAFYNAHTSGAQVGLGFSLLLVGFLYMILAGNKKVKYGGMTVLLLIILFCGFVYTQKEKMLKDTTLGSMAMGLSINKPTFQTRLISWKAAIKDFKNHPLLGTGWGNYAVIFDKYFDPKFYSYTRGETYFDRAHNNIIDIASTTGAIGILAYLSIFIATAYYLLKGYRHDNPTGWWSRSVAWLTRGFGDNRIDIHDFILLTGLFTAYFVQNLAVFDSLVTYVSLMVALGYVYFLCNANDFSSDYDRAMDNVEMSIWIGVGLVMLVIIYQYNYKVMKMLEATIDGQRAWSQGSVVQTYEAYKKASEFNTPLNRDSRSTFVRLLASGPQIFGSTPRAKANEILDFAISEGEKNTKLSPNDSLMQMELAQVYITAAEYNYNDPMKSNHYIDAALSTIDKSIAASPGRVPIYFVKSQIYLVKNDKEKAIETLKYAVTLSPEYYDSSCQLANVMLYYKMDKGYDAMNDCIDRGGKSLLSPIGYVKNLATYYAEKKDWPRAIKLYKRLVEMNEKDAAIWADLAKIYANNKENDNAKEAALKAAELNPGFKTAVDDFIKKLK